MNATSPERQARTVRALIAEDEPILADVLAQTLRQLWPELALLPIAANGVAAVETALSLRPDILFLDIKMPGQTGLEAAQQLAERWDGGAFPLIVFVTAYDGYAVQAFEQAALDYVLKPVDAARLARTVHRLQARLAADAAPAAPAWLGDDGLARLAAQMRALLPAPATAAKARLNVIRASVGNNMVRLIPVADVLYFQALDKYVEVVTVEGNALIRVSLKELLAQLDSAQFAQISRSCIANLQHLTAASREDNGRLTLHVRGTAARLPVSPLFAHLFRQM
ncbi:LytR/AlgR family response regulator transcription factor [Rugamonas aquatica]|uniref:Response regulator n=1 Tax=Rugamonas aquatica TaxID=2743357 RepID=A0A6A7MYJ6_9BURK|nr:LytTR family DNA-binding domain-containing protein [Rugamonas aquatica]MQA37833.1 response regulator [Rugamonas aquatica]